MNHVVIKDTQIGGKTGARFLIVYSYQIGSKRIYFVWRKVGNEMPERVGFTDTSTGLSSLWHLATGESLEDSIEAGIHFA